MKHLYSVLLMISMGIIAYGQETSKTPPIELKTNNSDACCNNGSCCDGTQTPAGVMTDHIHQRGEWMASYTYMDMAMKGNMIGTSKASDNAVYQTYMMAPATMSMQMHMGMLMYGVTDRLSVMGMFGYATNSMTMHMGSMPGMGTSSMTGMLMAAMPSSDMQSTSSGFTDTKIYGLYNLSTKPAHRIIASMGVSVPTGTIHARGVTMYGANSPLTYNMQTGTGSYSAIPGITWIAAYGKTSVGADAGADMKLNYNEAHYKPGNVYRGTMWVSHKLLSFVSGSLRAEGIHIDKISGSDPALNISLYQDFDPTARTANYGGQWVNAYAGLNFHVNKSTFKNFNLMLEYGIPVYQNVNGTQMSQRSNFIGGVQYAF